MSAADVESPLLPVVLLLLRLRLAESACDVLVVGGDQPRPAIVAIEMRVLPSCVLLHLELRISSVVSLMMRCKCRLKNQVSKLKPWNYCPAKLWSASELNTTECKVPRGASKLSNHRSTETFIVNDEPTYATPVQEHTERRY